MKNAFLEHFRFLQKHKLQSMIFTFNQSDSNFECKRKILSTVRLFYALGYFQPQKKDHLQFFLESQHPKHHTPSQKDFDEDTHDWSIDKPQKADFEKDLNCMIN